MPESQVNAPEPIEEPDPQNPTPELLLLAYARGIFPMADPESGEIGWYSPDPRGVIPLDDFRVRKSLARAASRGSFEIRSDIAFEAVMRFCARPRTGEDLCWIDDRLISAYVALHELGHAHSIEAWRDGELVGGLYGVHIGAAFFGESMFIRPERGGTNASKICLIRLVEHMRECGFTLLDTQFTNDHLEQFGCIEIPRDEYLHRLERAIHTIATWGDNESNNK